MRTKLNVRRAPGSLLIEKIKKATDGKYSANIISEIVEAFGVSVVDILSTGQSLIIPGLGVLELSLTHFKGNGKYDFKAEMRIRTPDNGKQRIRSRMLEFFDVTEDGIYLKTDESGNRFPLLEAEKDPVEKEKKKGKRSVI